MAAVIESMTKVKVKEFTIRIWRDEQSDLRDYYTNTDIENLAYDIDSMFRQRSQKDLVEAFLLLPNINAIEVLDADGNGVLFYPEWP